VDPILKCPSEFDLQCARSCPHASVYSRDPRYVTQKAEGYLKNTGIAQVTYWGPELEFYIFDDVRFDQTAHCGYYFVDSNEGVWNTGRQENRPWYKRGTKRDIFPVRRPTRFRTPL